MLFQLALTSLSIPPLEIKLEHIYKLFSFLIEPLKGALILHFQFDCRLVIKYLLRLRSIRPWQDILERYLQPKLDKLFFYTFDNGLRKLTNWRKCHCDALKITMPTCDILLNSFYTSYTKEHHLYILGIQRTYCFDFSITNIALYLQ